MATRAVLWNGNREPWQNLFRLDPNESIIAWAWTGHHKYRDRYEQAQASPANGHLTFIRLRTRADSADLLPVAALSMDSRQFYGLPPADPTTPGLITDSGHADRLINVRDHGSAASLSMITDDFPQ